MGVHAMEMALATYSLPCFRSVTIHHFEAVPCPICGKPCGGKSAFHGDLGRLEGVHQHLKFKHGIRTKWRRDEMLSVAVGVV